MADLGDSPWPSAPIRTQRLLLREPETGDRGRLIELFASPEVGEFLGGHRSPDELERTMPAIPRRRPGLFVVELDGSMIGIVELKARATSTAPDVSTPMQS